jgi:hypothetical protein
MIINIVVISIVLSHMNTGPISQFVDNLLAEARQLSNKNLFLQTKERFIDIQYVDNNRQYIYARIELATGDIYSQSGKTARGNIFISPYFGFDLINEHGVIVNNQKYIRRMTELVKRYGQL